MQIKVEDDKALVRDSTNSAILNTNRRGLEEYRRNRSQKLSLQSQINEMAEQLKALTAIVLNNQKINQE